MGNKRERLKTHLSRILDDYVYSCFLLIQDIIKMWIRRYKIKRDGKKGNLLCGEGHFTKNTLIDSSYVRFIIHFFSNP